MIFFENVSVVRDRPPPKWGQADAGWYPASAWPHLGGYYLSPESYFWRNTFGFVQMCLWICQNVFVDLSNCSCVFVQMFLCICPNVVHILIILVVLFRRNVTSSLACGGVFVGAPVISVVCLGKAMGLARPWTKMIKVCCPWNQWNQWSPWIPWNPWNPWIPWNPWNPRIPWIMDSMDSMDSLESMDSMDSMASMASMDSIESVDSID